MLLTESKTTECHNQQTCAQTIQRLCHAADAVAPNPTAYDLAASMLKPLPAVGTGAGFELPEYIFDDVFRSNPKTMAEMRHRKKLKIK